MRQVCILTAAVTAALALGCGSEEPHAVFQVAAAAETTPVSVRVTRGGQPLAAAGKAAPKLVLQDAAGGRYELTYKGKGVYETAGGIPVGAYTATLELGGTPGYRSERARLPVAPERIEVKPGGQPIVVAVR